MRIAFTVKSGRNAGENDRELNPIYRDAVKAAQDEYRKALARVGD